MTDPGSVLGGAQRVGSLHLRAKRCSSAIATAASGCSGDARRRRLVSREGARHASDRRPSCDGITVAGRVFLKHAVIGYCLTPHRMVHRASILFRILSANGVRAK
jgi:hypothetical protein